MTSAPIMLDSRTPFTPGDRDHFETFGGWMSLGDAARLFGVGKIRLQSACNRGSLFGRKAYVGRTAPWLVRPNDVAEYLKDRPGPGRPFSRRRPTGHTGHTGPPFGGDTPVPVPVTRAADAAPPAPLPAVQANLRAVRRAGSR